MFIVKRLGRNGLWNAVSLIDENGSFRGEAKFESEEEARDYLAVYLKRMEERLGGPVEGRAQVKVFDDSPRVEPPLPPKPQKPLKLKKPQKTRPIKKRKKPRRRGNMYTKARTSRNKTKIKSNNSVISGERKEL